MTDELINDDPVDMRPSRMQYIAATATENLHCLLQNPNVQVMYMPATTVVRKAVALALELDEALNRVQESIEGLPGEVRTDDQPNPTETKH